MDTGTVILLVIVLAAVFAGVAGGAHLLERSARKKLVKTVLDEAKLAAEEQRAVDAEGMKAAFGELSLEALSKATDEFMKLAATKLDTQRELGVKDLDKKKELIELRLASMNASLDSVGQLMQSLEKDRAEKFGELAQRLDNMGEQTRALTDTAGSLREALASSSARGQWGERMAEDVLRVAGFVEGVNYQKQKAIEGGSRPDFTFLLPNGLTLNMDVKFPLTNYIRHLEADNDPDRERYRKDFMRDVRSRIKEITTRDYIDPGGKTVDYVLLFIPNENVYAYIHSEDATILDDGLKQRVVLCSPITLFAVLAVIRQAVENFRMEQRSREMLSEFATFRAQWGKFLEVMDTVGKRMESAQKAYEELAGPRKRQLEKPLGKIEALRSGTDFSLEEALAPGPESDVRGEMEADFSGGSGQGELFGGGEAEDGTA